MILFLSSSGAVSLFSQAVLVFHILNINSSGQGLPLVTVLSTAFVETTKYPCNGNSSASQEEGASVHRPLKQKLKARAKAKEMDRTAASVLPAAMRKVPLCFSCTNHSLFLMSCLHLCLTTIKSF